MVLEAIIAGIGAAVTYGLSGYFKNNGQKVVPIKIARTVVIGAIVGLANGLFEADVAITYNYMIAMGAIPFVENALKGIHRRLIAIK